MTTVSAIHSVSKKVLVRKHNRHGKKLFGDQSLIMGRGLQNGSARAGEGGGGQVEFHHYKKGGRKRLTHDEGVRGKNSFEVVFKCTENLDTSKTC